MMTRHTFPALLALAALGVSCTGCTSAAAGDHAPAAAQRPDQVLNAAVLYKANCAACHGENGRNGAAISLENPVYLAAAGEQSLRTITEKGVPGTMMPAFSQQYGGFLTDDQIGALVKGILHDWARPEQFRGVDLPAYSAAQPGDPVRGKDVFAAYCARCHGDGGIGLSGRPQTDSKDFPVKGSIVDPTYLALVSDQALRSIVIAGEPDRGMPDWRAEAVGPKGHAMTELEISDAIAWLASHRVDAPGQVYSKPLLSPGNQPQSPSGVKP
jgi:mono/diheme cytochrome c family protein